MKENSYWEILLGMTHMYVHEWKQHVNDIVDNLQYIKKRTYSTTEKKIV